MGKPRCGTVLAPDQKVATSWNRAALAMNPNFTTVRRGSGVVPAEQGIRILGTPLGHEEYVRHHLDRTIQDHHELLQRIPSVPDVQSAWALLLHCANVRAKTSLRVVRPELVMELARARGAGLRRCMCFVLGIAPYQCDALSKDAATHPLSMGVVGSRSAMRTSVPAFWASWADSISVIRERHPSDANMIIEALESGPRPPTLAAVAESAHAVFGVQGFEPPSGRELSHGARPLREPDDHEPGGMRRGWQLEAASRVERQHREVEILPRLTDSEKASLRSQCGPGAASALSAVPSSNVFRISPQRCFAVSASPFLQSLAPADVAVHLIPVSRAGESAGARICREAGARVSTNVFVRDLDLPATNVHDARRLEIVAEGLPLFGRAQFSIDNSGVSAPLMVQRWWRRAARRPYPELVGQPNRWCWPWRSAEGVHKRQPRFEIVGSSKSSANAPFSRIVLSRRGSCAGQNVGVFCCSCIRWLPSRAAGQWWCRWRDPCTP